MEGCIGLFLLAGVVVYVLGAVPAVEVTKVVTGNCDAIQAEDGDNMIVNYEGTFTNGTVFDSSFAKNETFAFELGNPGLIKGWNVGLLGACVGDELQLKIPHSLGYGDAGVHPVIPPRTDLNFRIQVLGIEDVGLQLSPSANNATNNVFGYDDDPDVDHVPFDHSSLLHKLQFLAIPVAVVLLIVVVYCIYTIEYPDRKIKFYRVSDHDSSTGLNRAI